MLRSYSITLTALVVLIATIVLVGWAFEISTLKSVIPGFATMKANAALCFLFMGIAMAVYQRKSYKRNYWLPLIPVFILSIATLMQYAFNTNFGIDELLFKDLTTAPAEFPGRMTIFTAIGFCLSATALILTARNWLNSAQSILVIVHTFAFTVLLGYLFNSEILNDTSIFSTMPVPTALGFAFIGSGMLFIRPESRLLSILNEKGSAGKLLRRNVSFAFAVPIFFGLIISIAHFTEAISYSMGLAILVQSIILAALFGLWRNAYLIKREDEAQELHSAELTISHEKFMSIFHEVSDIILIIDGKTGIIRTINPACTLFLNFAPQELIGQHFKTLFKNSIEPGFLDKVTFVRDIMLEQPIRKADDTFLLMDLTTKVILWEGERAVLVTLRDASERKQMQEELMIARLKQIELEKEHELVNMKEAFIAGISHDFKNPLSVISLSSDILHRYYDRLNLDQTLTHLDRIRFQAHFMKEMIDDVMTFVESHQGEIITQMQLIDLVALCKSIITDLNYQYPNHDINFEIDKHPGSLVLDPRLMRRAITNLLSNALKYSAEDTPVSLRLSLDENTLLLEVEDRGIGIPLKDQERLFKAFQRASNVENIKGTGLGLVIVRDCVSVHGGTVSFKTKEGRGTTFTVRIPRQTGNSQRMTGVHSA
ncbi:MAG: PAS domain-containing sensor histidine kinase [Aggregatilineales bacterium]